MMAGVATLVVTGCQREEQAPSPLYNPETKEVTAEFVLNISAAGRDKQTKMTADAVQQDNNFRGIHNVHIYTYATNAGTGQVPYVLSTDGPAPDGWTDSNSKDFPLGTLYTSGQIDNTGDKNATESSNRVLQLSIPVGTDAVLFYGKALNDEEPTMAQNKSFGRTLSVFSKTPKDIEFKVYRRIGEDYQVKDYDATARLMIFVINRIMGSKVEAGDYDATYKNLPELTWKELGEEYESGAQMQPLDEILGKAYYTFANIKSTEYRAGSSDAIKYMMSNMWNVIRPVTTTATPTDNDEANAKRLALEIERRMDEYFTDTWEYKDVSVIKTIVTDAEKLKTDALTEAQWADLCWDTDNPNGDNFDVQNYTGRASNLNNYPYLAFRIPEGAAQLSYNKSTGKFSYLHPNKPLVNPNAESFDPKKYVYAPELAYYVNSPVRVNNTLLTADNLSTLYPNGTENWSDDAEWTTMGWTPNGKVSSSTKSVAVRDNINYGVALLKTSVALADGVTKLADNRYILSGKKEADQTLDIDATHHPIALTGVLVGGVNPRYNWQFLRKYSTYDSTTQPMDYTKFDGVIYDDDVKYTTVPTVAEQENYTLVYDNYDSGLDADNQSSVYVALEFKNQSGLDIWGRDNLIPNNAKFYLVAQLVNSAARQASITWPSDHQIPPLWGVDGEEIPSGQKQKDNVTPSTPGLSKQIPRIFIQDFMTTAVFILSADALKSAYYTMPDLRTSNMSLGLSVDLEWETGYVFDDLVF